MTKLSFRALACVWLVLLTASSVPAQPVFRLIALTGEAAPGVSGALFSDVFAPSINASGDVTFFAEFAGAGVTSGDDGGVFGPSAGAQSPLGLVAREGAAAPGTAGALFSEFGDPAINASSEIAFTASLAGSGVNPTNENALFGPSVGGLDLLVRGGQAAPGAAGAVYDAFSDPAFNDSADVAFQALLATGTTGPAVTNDDDQALFGPSAGAGSSLGLIAREGGVAPGLGGAEFASFSTPAINAAGEVAFNASLRTGPTGPVVTGADNSVLMIAGQGAPGSLGSLFREGEAIPGAGGDTFDGPFGDVQLGDSGDAVFNADLGSNDNVIIVGPTAGAGTPLGVIAVEGGVAPGTGGALFGDDIDGNVSINAQGDLVFESEDLQTGTANPPVTNDNNEALFALIDGVLQIVVREDDTIDYLDTNGATQTKTIGSLAYAAGGFNDALQVAVELRFTDGTEGVFVIDLATTTPGDFDADGMVTAADYAVWRSTCASAGDYDEWTANFEPASAVVSPTVAVPEPATLLASLVGAGLFLGRRR